MFSLHGLYNAILICALKVARNILFIHTVESGPSRIGLRRRGEGGSVFCLPTKLKFGDHPCTFPKYVLMEGGGGGSEIFLAERCINCRQILSFVATCFQGGVTPATPLSNGHE